MYPELMFFTKPSTKKTYERRRSLENSFIQRNRETYNVNIEEYDPKMPVLMSSSIAEKEAEFQWSHQELECAWCLEKRLLQVCSRCQRVSYCSEECQTHSWKSHRSVCKALKNAVDDKFTKLLSKMKNIKSIVKATKSQLKKSAKFTLVKGSKSKTSSEEVLNVIKSPSIKKSFVMLRNISSEEWMTPTMNSESTTEEYFRLSNFSDNVFEENM